MFIKSFLVSSAVVLAASLQVAAHAAIDPAFGLAAKAVRNDVQRPSTAAPCGKAAFTTIDSSTAIAADATGLFTATVTDFNAGADGSRSIAKATVNTDGTGKSFAGVATVKTNGQAAPTAVGSDTVSIQLPAGTSCTGGATKNKCIVSLTTTAGFGNCVVVSTPAAAGGAAAAAAPAAAAAAAPAAASATTATSGTTAAGAAKAAGKKGQGKKAKAAAAAKTANAAKAAAPKRNARSLVDNVANNVNTVRSWVWAQ